MFLTFGVLRFQVVYNLSLPIQSELESIKPWLQNIHARAPHCPVIIVGTHYDKVTMQASGEFIQTIRGQISDMCEQPGYPEVVGEFFSKRSIELNVWWYK